jgi:hypothetical protein
MSPRNHSCFQSIIAILMCNAMKIENYLLSFISHCTLSLVAEISIEESCNMYIVSLSYSLGYRIIDIRVVKLVMSC